MKKFLLKSLFYVLNGEDSDVEDLSVPRDILHQATKCLKGYSCLRERKRDICAVDYGIQESVIFIKDREMTPCFYYNCFGSSHFCACPVRKKIYVQYHI
jgi:hypothetical protein